MIVKNERSKIGEKYRQMIKAQKYHCGKIVNNE